MSPATRQHVEEQPCLCMSSSKPGTNPKPNADQIRVFVLVGGHTKHHHKSAAYSQATRAAIQAAKQGQCAASCSWRTRLGKLSCIQRMSCEYLGLRHHLLSKAAGINSSGD